MLVLGAAPAHALTVTLSDPEPLAPAPGQDVTFRASTSTKGVTWAWNFDFDRDDPMQGWGGPDASTATHSFTRGRHTVAVSARKDDNWGWASTVVTVGRPPAADFSVAPGTPAVGEAVTFTSTSASPDTGGEIKQHRWTIDGQPAGSEPTATATFATEGEHSATLEVTDELGYTASRTLPFVVVSRSAQPQPQPQPTPGGGFDTPASAAAPAPAAGALLQFNPMPFIRIKGHTTGRGAQIDLFTVRAERGARVWVRCVGRRCPKRGSQRKQVKTSKTTGTVRFRRIQGWYRAGAIIEIRVTKQGYMGRYTRFRIGKVRPPVRWDGCLAPGGKGPTQC